MCIPDLLWSLQLVCFPDFISSCIFISQTQSNSRFKMQPSKVQEHKHAKWLYSSFLHLFCNPSPRSRSSTACLQGRTAAEAWSTSTIRTRRRTRRPWCSRRRTTATSCSTTAATAAAPSPKTTSSGTPLRSLRPRPRPIPTRSVSRTFTSFTVSEREMLLLEM